MSLEEELSLAKSGGVYYEGERVQPTKDPVLFVGLGGTGADALLRIKNEVQQRMPLPKDNNGRIIGTSPKNIAFLEFDTDVGVMQKRYGVAGFDPHGDELVDITVDGLPDVVRAVVTRQLDSPIWNWYDPALKPVGGMNGANGIRQVGRFMFIQNIGEIIARANKVIQDISIAAQTNNLKIFLITGIGGGTGSGTFLDAAYVLRDLARTRFPNVEVQGYILTPDINAQVGGDVSSLYRNGFAALKELDYWMSIKEHENPFQQQYSPTYRLNTMDAPFDFCHIITSQDMNNNILKYPEIMDAIGGAMFSYIVYDSQADAAGNGALFQTYNNVAGYEANMNMPYPANYHMESVGYMKLEIPYTEIMTLLAARVFEKLDPMFKRAPDRDSFQNDLKNLQMTSDMLWNDVHAGIPANPLVGRRVSYDDIWPGNNLYNECSQWNIHAQKVLRQNASNLPKVKEGIFTRYMDALMGRADRGPCYAARLLYSNANFNLISTLAGGGTITGFIGDCREREATAARQAGNLKSAVDIAYQRGANMSWLNPRRGQVTSDYVTALTNWLNNEYAYWAYHDLADALEEYVERLRVYQRKIFSKLLGCLEILPGIFQNNLQKVNSDSLLRRNDPTYQSHFLVEPLDFEAQYQTAIAQKVGIAANTFATKLKENLKKWVGIELNEIDSTIAEEPDVSGAISDFMSGIFAQDLTFSVEQILQRQIPAGTTNDAFYRTVLENLSNDAVPMFHQSAVFAGVQAANFSILSIPDNCTGILNAATLYLKGPNCQVLKSSESRNIQFVKVVAGVPLFAFPEVAAMEQYYEAAMKGGTETRAGVHLRHEWREKLPSPLPESTWAVDVKDYAEKQFTKQYNAEIRAAFEKCLKGNILVPHGANGSYTLLVTNPETLRQARLYGSSAEQLKQLRQLRNTLWNMDNPNNITLEAKGPAVENDPLFPVRENVLRFYNLSDAVKQQAAILDEYDSMVADIEDVNLFCDAKFAGLIYRVGFSMMLRLSQNDPFPKTLIDTDILADSSTPDFELYKAFKSILNDTIRNNIRQQYDQCKRGLLTDGEPDPARLSAKVAELAKEKAAFMQGKNNVQHEISNLPLEMRGPLEKVSSFYDTLLGRIAYYAKGLETTI